MSSEYTPLAGTLNSTGPVTRVRHSRSGGWTSTSKATTEASRPSVAEQTSPPALPRVLHRLQRLDSDFDDDVGTPMFILPNRHSRTPLAASWRDRLVYFCCIRTHLGLALDLLQASGAIASVGVLIACTYSGDTIFSDVNVLIFDSIVSTYFLGDYIVRVYLAQRRWQYVFTFLAIVDLVTVLPIVIELLASWLVSNSESFNDEVIADVTRAMQAVRILRIISLARLAPKKELAKILFETCIVIVSIVLFSSFLFQLAENDDVAGGANVSVPFHRALYNVTIEVLGRPRIPFNSIFTEFILLATIVASFALVLPRIAMAGRLWLVAKPKKTFIGRDSAPHIVLVIDDNDDRYPKDPQCNTMRESLSKRILLLLLSLVTSQKRKALRMQQHGEGHSSAVPLETQIVIVVRGRKLQEIQKLVDTDSRFHRSVTCLEMEQVSDLHRADLGHASHVFILGDGGRADIGHGASTSLTAPDVMNIFRHRSVVDLGAGNHADHIHDMRLATWALQAKHILAQNDASLGLSQEVDALFEAANTPIAELTPAGPGKIKSCACCRGIQSVGVKSSHRSHPQILVQFQSLASKRLARSLPRWRPGRDHYVFAQRLKVALMAQAVLWPGINQLFETWVLPVEAFGAKYARRGNKPFATNEDGESLDDVEEWGWMDEYSRGLAQIMHSGDIPQAAIGKRMGFVAAKMQKSAQRVLLLGVYRPHRKNRQQDPNTVLKHHKRNRGKMLLFNPDHLIEPGDIGIYVSSESDRSALSATGPVESARQGNEPAALNESQLVSLKNELAEAILCQVIGNDWAETPAANSSHHNNNNSGKKSVPGGRQREIGPTDSSSVDSSPADCGPVSGSPADRHPPQPHNRHVLVCGGRLSTTARSLIQQLSASIEYCFGDQAESSPQEVVYSNISITFLGLWEEKDEDFIRECFRVQVAADADDAANQHADGGSNARRRWSRVKATAVHTSSSDPHRGVDRLRFVRGDTTSSVDLLKAGVMTAYAAIIIDPASSEVGRQDPLLEDMRTIHSTLAIRRLRPSLHVVTELLHQHHSKYLCTSNPHSTKAAVGVGHLSVSRWTTASTSQLSASDDEGSVDRAHSRDSRQRSRSNHSDRLSALAVEAVAAGNVCSTGIVEGLLMRFVDDPIVVPVLRKLIVLSAGRKKRHLLTRRGMPAEAVLELWGVPPKKLSKPQPLPTQTIATATGAGLESQKSVDSQHLSESRATAYEAATRLLAQNPLLCSVRLPNSLVGLQYHYLETHLLEAFGLLALGLRRRAPGWAPVAAHGGLAGEADCYLSAAPDPSTVLREHDCVYVLRASAPKQGTEDNLRAAV